MINATQWCILICRMSREQWMTIEAQITARLQSIQTIQSAPWTAQSIKYICKWTNISLYKFWSIWSIPLILPLVRANHVWKHPRSDTKLSKWRSMEKKLHTHFKNWSQFFAVSIDRENNLYATASSAQHMHAKSCHFSTCLLNQRKWQLMQLNFRNTKYRLSP